MPGLKHAEPSERARKQLIYHSDNEAWHAVVLEELFGGLKPADISFVSGLLERVNSLCASAAEVADEDEPDEEMLALGKAANAALGAAIRSMGAEAVLEILPLNLQVAPLQAS